jgi:threonyl-tRNA synthetase
MIQITLPDGSRREFPRPVTVAEVAASIGSGLAKAALAVRVGSGGRPARRHQPPHRGRRALAIVTDKDKPTAWSSSATRRRTCWPMR